MKVFVKTLEGTHFEIQVEPEDTVAEVKEVIETLHGSNVYPVFRQMLIYQGRVLKDDTTLSENKVAENSFLVIRLTKSKSSAAEGSAQSSERSRKVSQTNSPPSTSTAPQASLPVSAPVPVRAAAPAPAPVPATNTNTTSVAGVRDPAVSNLVPGMDLDETVQQIVDMGGGIWDRDIVARALSAASNNPERAIEYLYSGIPEQAAVPRITRIPISGPDEISSGQGQPLQPAVVRAPSGGSNADPFNIFPQGLLGVGTNAPLDFLRNSQQFQALRAMVHANSEILQPMLQELWKQNPNLMRLIQQHQADFLRLINEPIEGGVGNIMGQFASAMPQPIQVTPSERDAIERLEAMGFERPLVLEVFFACNKNEELAANYLLDHMHELED